MGLGGGGVVVLEGEVGGVVLGEEVVAEWGGVLNWVQCRRKIRIRGQACTE